MLTDTLIVLDTETGGLDPTQHSLLTVGLLVVKNKQVVDKKEWKIKHPMYAVTADALKVNKIDIQELDEIGTHKEQVGIEIVEFLSQYCSKESKGMYVGQNTIFDKNFMDVFFKSLEHSSAYESYKNLVSHRYIDLMSITAFLNLANVMNTEGLGLDKVIDWFNLTAKDRHTALDDAQVTFDALLRMIELVSQPQTV